MENEDCFEAVAYMQACDTAKLLLSRGVKSIDAQLGEGYASDNPAVLAQWITVAGSQMAMLQQIHYGNGLANQIERLAVFADAIEASAAAACAGKVQ